RFYQVRIYAGDYNVSGVSILGVPFPSLGHSRYCSIAMTTGGPDTSDIYEEELNPANPRQYRYDGKWRDVETRKTKLGVKKDDAIDWREVEIEYTHHGPIVAHKAGKAYSMAIPYANEVGLTDQIYEMMMAQPRSDEEGDWEASVDVAEHNGRDRTGRHLLRSQRQSSDSSKR